MVWSEPNLLLMLFGRIVFGIFREASTIDHIFYCKVYLVQYP